MNMEDAASQRTIRSTRSAKRNTETQMGAPSFEGEFHEDYGETSEGHEDEHIGEAENAQEHIIRFIDAQVSKHLTRFIKRRAEDLAILRIRLQLEPFVPQDLTDEQLIIYLFTAKYNIAAAVTLLRSNYKLRVVLPDLFTSRSVLSQDINNVWQALRAAPFPKSTADQQHICYIGLRMKNAPEKFDAHYAMKLLLMCVDVYHILEGIPRSIILILDGAGASYGYFTKKNYEHLKIAVKYVQECLPFVVAAVHVINSTALMKGLFKFIRPFLTKEMIKTIYFYNANLGEALPAHVLPAELGGTCLGTIDEYQTRFREKFEQMQDFFEIEEEQRAVRYFGGAD